MKKKYERPMLVAIHMEPAPLMAASGENNAKGASFYIDDEDEEASFKNNGTITLDNGKDESW